MIKKVEFKSNETTLRGSVFMPEKNNGGIVIMATGDGLSGSKSSTWSGLTDAFYNAGIPCFLFDFQGLGYSDGIPSKLTITIGLENLKSAIKFVKNEDWINSDKIGLLGSSFGGNIALLHAAMDESISTIGLKSPASFYPEAQELELGEERMSVWKENGIDTEYGFDYSFYLDSMEYNTYSSAKRIKCSCFIVHGNADTVVPIQQSKRLIHSLITSSNAQLRILKGVNHDYKQGNAKEEMTQLLVNWFNNNFK